VVDFLDARPADGRVEAVSPFGLGRTLLAAAARASRGRDCGDLDDCRAPGRRAVAAALPADRLASVDPDEVARSFVELYPRRGYPGVVVGSPHGGAVHLATALRVPWLPAGFDLSVRWDGGDAGDPRLALADGASAAWRLLSNNDSLTIRQVHDPVSHGPLAGRCLTFHAHWTRLPKAYRDFLAECLIPRAPVLLVRDARTWPVTSVGRRFSFQVGTPAAGLTPDDYTVLAPDLRRSLGPAGDAARWASLAPAPGREYAEHGVEPGLQDALRTWSRRAGSSIHRVLYSGPEVFSAAVADLHREWLRGHGKPGHRLVIECGRLLDPWQVSRAGLVPYWCESALRGPAAGAGWWLAGARPFQSIEVLVEPVGWAWSALAPLEQWRGLAAFADRRSELDRAVVRTYPFGPVPASHATAVLRAHPYDLPIPPPMRFDDVLAGLRELAGATGLLVSAG
jgi:hypothetical protein